MVRKYHFIDPQMFSFRKFQWSMPPINIPPLKENFNKMSLIHNVTTQNGQCSVGLLYVRLWRLYDYTNSEVFESSEDHRLIGTDNFNSCVSFQ